MVVMEGERTWYEGAAGANQHPNSPLPSATTQHHQESSGAEADSYFKGSAASQYFSQAAAMQSAYGGMTHGELIIISKLYSCIAPGACITFVFASPLLFYPAQTTVSPLSDYCLKWLQFCLVAQFNILVNWSP